MEIFVYIDIILLYTNKDFSNHIQQLKQIIIKLKQNYLHVHVEDTFLASKKVEYLGHTLTPKGVQPQISKVIPILQLAGSKTKKKFGNFLE